MSNFKKLIITSFALISLTSLNAQADFYWVGGSGSWNDVSMWYKDAAGVFATGVLPDKNAVVHFTDLSGVNEEIVSIPPGTIEVHSILIETADKLTLELQGTSGNTVDVNIYGDITFLSTTTLTYAGSFASHNSWNFVGSNDHILKTGGLDMYSIEIHGAGVNFDQHDDLQASAQIRMFGGVWNTNGFSVSTGFLWFRDDAGSSNAISKIFNTSGSSIFCNEWDSKLTYGSLTVSGAHKIFVDKFTGSPKQQNGPSFFFDEIYLQEYTDANAILVSTYNFECTECVIKNITIEDTGITKLAGKFTVTGKLEVTNPESIIQFSSGNGRIEEVVIDGLVVTPTASGCDARTIFENRHSDFITIIRNSGTLTISDAILNNVKTSGAANFNLSNGFLQGSSTGWNLINTPPAQDYFWRGPAGSIGDWNDVSNWKTSGGGPALCLPTLNDHIHIDGDSKSDIRIPADFEAYCNDFNWTNKESLTLILDGTNFLSSTLTIGGNFNLLSFATITGNFNHNLIFSSFQSKAITTEGVSLPKIRFQGEAGDWYLQDVLICDELLFEGGTLNTGGANITANEWLSFSSTPKHFNLSSSTITINGEMSISATESYNVTVNPGSSHIICEELVCFVPELNDVEFINASPITLNNYTYTFNRLILNGAGQVTLQEDMTLTSVLFMSDGSSLALDPNDDFVILNGILSETSSADPGVLKSKNSGVRAEVTKSIGNFCAMGPIAFQDIQMVVEGVTHAPEGVDNGNNIGISFIPFPTSQNLPLYWVGKTTNWATRSNWSSVSGGCSTNFNPNNRPKLVFDGHSTYLNNNVILFAITNTNEIEFNGVQGELIFDNRVDLNLSTITVDESWVRFIGKDYSVSGAMNISNGATVDFRAREMIALQWLFNSSFPQSLLIVRDGSELRQEN